MRDQGTVSGQMYGFMSVCVILVHLIGSYDSLTREEEEEEEYVFVPLIVGFIPIKHFS